jgi:hypothetical protein
MSNQLQLLVGGVDLTKYCDQKSWTVSQQWSRSGDTGDFYLEDEHPDNPLSFNFVVKPMSTVLLKDLVLGITVYSGVVSQPEMTWEGPNLNKWHLSCRDWTILADMAVVSGDYLNTPADVVIENLVSGSVSGLSATSVASGGFIAPGPNLARAKLKHQSLTQAIKNVENLSSQSGAQFGFWIDENQKVHFYNTQQTPDSGVTLTDAKVPSTSVLGHFDRNFTYLWDGTSIRNDILLRGSSVSAMQSDNFYGDAITHAWSMTFAPDTTQLNTAVVTVNGSGETVAIDNGQAPTTQWLITKSVLAQGIGQWFLRLGTRAVPNLGDHIVLTYSYLQPVETEVRDLNSIASLNSLPNGGRLQMYLSDPTLVNVLAAKSRGLRELAEYSVFQERMNCDITEDFGGHVRAGYTLSLSTAVVPDSKNSYTPGLNGKFLIISNDIQGAAGWNRRYKLKMVRVG